MHQPQEALSDIEKAIDLTPEDETAYLLRGRIYEELSNPEVAEQNYQQVIELNPFNEEAYLLAGSLLIGQKKYDEAIEFFNEAIEIKPDFPKIYSERGKARNFKGDKKGALEDLKNPLN